MTEKKGLAETFTNLVDNRNWLPFFALVAILFIAIFVAVIAYTGSNFFLSRLFEPKTSEIVPSTLSVAHSEGESSVAGARVRVLKEEDWDFEESKSIRKMQDPNGDESYYCAKIRQGYEYATFFSSLPINLKEQISLSYSLKKDPAYIGKPVNQNPEVIFIFGKPEKPLFSLFIPLQDRRFVGLEDNSPIAINRFSRHPLNYIMPLEEESQISLQLSVSNPFSNEAVIFYDLEYFADVDNYLANSIERRLVSVADHFQSYFPWPDPSAPENLQSIGIGLYPGMCIKLYSPQISLVQDRK